MDLRDYILGCTSIQNGLSFYTSMKYTGTEILWRSVGYQGPKQMHDAPPVYFYVTNQEQLHAD